MKDLKKQNLAFLKGHVSEIITSIKDSKKVLFF